MVMKEKPSNGSFGHLAICPSSSSLLSFQGVNMNVDLIDHMGSDLTVVNAARVSYAKTKTLMDMSDVKLLSYLASHKHWTPYAHPQMSFRIKATIQVARQLFRHEVGLALNETSRRYVQDDPIFEYPGPFGATQWRSAPGKGQSKQGSGQPIEHQLFATSIAVDAFEAAEKAYKRITCI